MARTALFFIAASLLSVAVGCAAPTEGDEVVAESSDAIVGGTEATPGSWAGTVALYMGSSQACGGTLIHASWVLTAGHCVNPSQTNGGISKVVIGRHRLSQTTTTGESRTVDKVIRHASFDSWTMNNDIALLHLSTPSTGAKAKLITAAQASSLSAGSNVTVVGWGNTKESGRGGSSDVLRQVTLPVISNSECVTYNQYEDVTSNIICAAFEDGGKDSCQGDSGGPLFMTLNNQKTQVGIVSWGIGCARAEAPGVYTRLSNYISWINQKTNNALAN